MKASKKVLTLTLSLITVIVSSCSLIPSGQIEKQINTDWRLTHEDSDLFINPDFNDSKWEKIGVLKNVNLGKSKYFWIRKTITIPSDFNNSEVYLAFPKTNSAAKVWANGTYIGQRGSFPPMENVRTEKMNDVLIPKNCINDGKVTLAIKVYSPGSIAEGLVLSLHNDEAAYFTNNKRNIYNQRVYIYIAVLSLFMLFYSLNQYFANKQNTSYFYFALSVFFVIFYFYDLGAENLFIPYVIHRPFVRACLPISMLFLGMFLNRFFKRSKAKPVLIGTISISILSLIIYYLNMGNDSALGLLFNLFLLPVFIIIVYGFITSIHGIKTKQPYSILIFLGFFLGSAFAAHDIIYMILGKTPFMWIQGFAFFFVDLFVFLTLNLQATKLAKEVSILATETEKQKNLLKTVIDNAMNMAKESNNVAETLNESVIQVVSASEDTNNHVKEINNAIIEQTRIREETAKAISKLTEFLTQMNVDFENESKAIAITANGTQEVIKGIQTVGEGISTAAEFSSSLTKLTEDGTKDMQKLMEVMSTIQSSSKEILSIITTLDDFTQQTDLLSMNASIEAAHSGEAGKGFAVIAHEIKNLASQTSQWSAKIGEIITSVINSIADSVELSGKVNKALSEIEKGAELSAEKVGAAARGMKSQEEAGEEIAHQSTNLAKTAEKMQEEVMNQSAFSTQVLQNMEELLNASKSVDEASHYISQGTVRLSEEATKLHQVSERTASSAKALLEIMENAI